MFVGSVVMHYLLGLSNYVESLHEFTHSLGIDCLFHSSSKADCLPKARMTAEPANYSFRSVCCISVMKTEQTCSPKEL